MHSTLDRRASPSEPAPHDIPRDVLERYVEELSVAEEELRTQQDELISANLRLVRERERFQSLFELAPVPYLVTDRDGVILAANRAAEQLLHASGGHLGGRPLSTFIPFAGRVSFHNKLRLLHGHASASTLVLRIDPRDGGPRLVTATVAVVRSDSGELSELRWLLVDDTERRLREREMQAVNEELEARVAERTAELAAATEEKEQLLREAQEARAASEHATRATTDLLTMVSHEMRTPLSAAAGHAELLAMEVHGVLTAEQRSLVAHIQHAQSHIGRMLDDLLTYFRLGAGKLRVRVDVVTVADVVAGVEPLIQPLAEARSIRVELAGDPSLTARADPDRVRQIVLNLLSNAVKHTARGGVIAVRWERAGEAGGDVDVTVCDTGVGIAPDRRESIFEPFVQLGETAADVPAGFGLGLAISRALARAMGGELSVESEIGCGATFRLRLRGA